jgi:hypothetical protein
MSEGTTTSTDGDQASTSGLPQAGTPATDGQAPVSHTATTTATIDDSAKLIDRLRKENAEARKRLSAYEEAEKQAQEAQRIADEAKLSEIERIKKQHADAEARIKQQQQQLVMAQVKLLAKDKGIINPELIAPVVERKLEYDKDGEPTNLEQVLDDLIKGNPYLVKQPEPAVPPAQTAPTPTAPAVPVMNPPASGRASFTHSNNPTGKPTRLEDVQWSR